MADSSRPTLPTDSGNALLRLLRTDREAGRRVVDALTPEDQRDLCLELEPRARGELLMALEHPEKVVPHLPETELTQAILASGTQEAGWLLAFATEEQRVACIDLDCFDFEGFNPDRIGAWIDALIDAGTPTLLAAFDEIDGEIWVLALRAMASFSIGDGEGLTEDGVVFYTPESEEDYDRVREILQTLLFANPQRYWSLVHAALDGATAECEQWAQRWREARLADLGFPSREQAMVVYRPLRADQLDLEGSAVVWASEARAGAGPGLVPRKMVDTRLGEGLRSLSPERATEVLGYVAAVANALAVADRLELGDPETVRTCGERALRGIEAGIQIVCERHVVAPHRALEGATPMQLFRIGAAKERRRGRSS